MRLPTLWTCCLACGLVIIIIGSGGFNLVAQEIMPPTCYSGNRLQREFFRDEMIYPDRALQAGIEGTVKLSFVVNSDSTVSDLQVIGKVSPEIDREAIRLFRHILWYPATKLGIPVTYRHTMEIKFELTKYQKHTRTRGYDYFSHPHDPIDTSFRIYYRKETNPVPKPIFNSLEKNLSNFISMNLQYPDAAFKQNISGKVRMRFVVEPTGRISNIQVLQAVGGGCTEEAIRVVKLIRWYPGLVENTAVRTFTAIEITFDISTKTVGGSIPTPGQLQ